MSASTAIRPVVRVIDSILAEEGGGFLVRRPFPTGTLDHFDPFLLLDEMMPHDVAPGDAVGAPDHPHRGFETVSYILAGELEHRDSAGNAGRLGAGDVQWMTAGAGVVHSEMPSARFQREGGRMHGFQIWVNLPKRDKLMKPRYQDVPASRIPRATSPDGKVSVNVIAGEAMGVKAVIDTRTPIVYLHYTLQPGGRTEVEIPGDFNAFAYVMRGALRAGGRAEPVREGQMAVFGQDGARVALEAPADGAGAELLVLAGLPLREPVARYGPFVMNTREEIVQAFRDFQEGRMGQIDQATRSH